MSTTIEKSGIKLNQEDSVFDIYADEWGPEKIVYIYEPRCGLRGIVVIDNSSIGPAIGGIRMTPTVNTQEVFRLARAMTWKNALAGIPHGGGKSGIIADPRKLTPEKKETLIRQFARGIETLNQYIPGPDMGTDETSMAWVRDEIRRSVGLSSVLGGIPLDQVGATGFGLAVCAEIAQEFAGIKLNGATVSIQGFGNVGQHAARYLTHPKRGAVVVSATDLAGTVYNPDGLDVEVLCQLMKNGQKITEYDAPGTKILERHGFIDLPVDIFVPAAQPDVITEENAHQLKCKLMLQGANIPCTTHAESILHERGIICVPDFVANAGGVICGSVEYHGGTKTAAFQEIEEKMKENTHIVLKKASSEKLKPREAALELAKERVREAMSYRRAN
ncbi:MAG: Glu/Leu/Phe/Val dehydrogenase [Pirellulaceae bacterium]|jgi:glutamate dehydrogenase (NAD(P)+)|nr:Glu/Leu/Phe/Val dehydrogenase [Pirellulaceae bacterium]